MKELRLCVHAVVKTLNLEISRCHLADYVKELSKVRAARAARLFFLFQPIRSLFSSVIFALPSSLLKLPINTEKGYSEADVSHRQG